MKKFDWGSGIILAITLFIIATLSVVSYLISLDFYLVSNDHYEEGVQYQQTIDGKKRADNLEDPVVVLFDEPTVSIRVLFPDKLQTDSLKGNITFYRPNDSSKDKFIQLKLDDNGRQVIPVQDFDKGKWKLIIEWQQDSLSYIQEKNILI